MDIYQELIMEHARNPRNAGRIKGVRAIRAKNPFCGDEAEIYLKTNNTPHGWRIADIKYEIQGCILSRASLSIFSEHIKGKSLREVVKIKDEDIFDPLLAIRIIGMPKFSAQPISIPTP